MFQVSSFRNFVFALGVIATASLATASPTCPQLEIAVVDKQGTRSIPGSDGKLLHLQDTPLLSMADFTGATVTLSGGKNVLNINLGREGGLRVQEFSKDHVGITMAFIENGHVIRTAKMRDPIRGDGFLIGPFDRAKADALADAINKKSNSAGHTGAECGPPR